MMKLLLPFLLLGALGACTSIFILEELYEEHQGYYKVGKPYKVNGVWYYPKEDPDYEEVGMASWYGAKFHGRLTANGEIFDKNKPSAAHRTLPMPSIVRVTNLENGRTMRLRVNDRGPFAKGRILDLSEQAARMLGAYEPGTARVRVTFDKQATARLLSGEHVPTRVSEAPLAPEMGEATQAGFFIQVGAFGSEKTAQRVQAELIGLCESAQIFRVQYQTRALFRVRCGPVAREEEADHLLENIRLAGYPDAIAVLEE